MTNTKKVFKCFSSLAAGYLRRQGFKILGTETNKIKPQYDVFLFEDSPELRDAFDNYQKARGNSKKRR